ncbi:DUF6094 domain-containing protein [Syntrophomonas palmitatica]|uniref:DUF6094 domain-containing protein n=1 Tax=Syntrophomonas palmitatica TaxID=402877 RepID=UPI0006D15197|nr:DUF6094 domain-containing protein [Syntrophomonas palmitatica]
MTRLAAQADLEYFPTQERIRPIIRSYLSFPESGTTAFDPCCGPGDALQEICPDQYLFGMELHTGRALEAKSKTFVKVLAGPFENCTVSNRAFGFIHLNPPYDWVAGGGERYEEQFLYRATNYLAPRGVLEFLVPTTLFEYQGEPVLKFLLENYRDIKIFKYPEPEFQQFQQVVVFGVKKPQERVTASPKWFAEQIARITMGDIPELELQNEPLYQVPAINPGLVKVFRVNHYDKELAESESQTLSILQTQSKPVLKDNLTAPYLLDKALLALLAVGGYVDGIMPKHYLLGKYENHEETTHEIDVDSGEEVTITRKKSTTVFYALTPQPGPDGSRIAVIR